MSITPRGRETDWYEHRLAEAEQRAEEADKARNQANARLQEETIRAQNCKINLNFESRRRKRVELELAKNLNDNRDMCARLDSKQKDVEYERSRALTAQQELHNERARHKKTMSRLEGCQLAAKDLRDEVFRLRNKTTPAAGGYRGSYDQVVDTLRSTERCLSRAREDTQKWKNEAKRLEELAGDRQRQIENLLKQRERLEERLRRANRGLDAFFAAVKNPDNTD